MRNRDLRRMNESSDRLDKQDLDFVDGKQLELMFKLLRDIPNGKKKMVDSETSADIVRNTYMIPAGDFKGLNPSDDPKAMSDQLKRFAQKKGVEITDYNGGLGFVEVEGKFKGSPQTVAGNTYVTLSYDQDESRRFGSTRTPVVMVELMTYPEDIAYNRVLKYDK